MRDGEYQILPSYLFPWMLHGKEKDLKKGKRGKRGKNRGIEGNSPPLARF